MKVIEIRRNALRRKSATAWKGHPTTLWLPSSYMLLVRVLILTVKEVSDAFIPSALLRECQIVPLVKREYVKRAVSIMKDDHGVGDPDDDMEDDDDYDNEGIVTPSLPIGDVSSNDDGTEDGDDEDRYLIEDHDDNDDEYLVTIGTKIPTHNSPKWEMYNDFDQFLNQCTVQSFVFLLRTCRDIHTVQWIENFTKPIIDPFVTSISTTVSGSNNLGPLLLSYHGLGAMNITSFPTWESYYYDLLQQSKQIYIIESYQKHIPTYEIEINPVSLCNRMISVREQIAKEISHDLHIISQMNINTILQPRTAGTYDSKGSTGPSRYMLAMDDTMFLDSIQMNDDDGNSIMPSPLRKGNFDLLLLYITQESIHRILNDNSYNEKNKNNRMNTDEVVITLTKDEEQLLSNFYLHRLVTHFTGRQSYGRAYQFLQELLSIRQQSQDVSPIVLEDDEDDDEDGDDEEYESDETHYINTERIVLHILRTRQQIAKEYSVHTSNISNLHVNIRKIQLNLLMQSYNSPNVVGQSIVTSTPSSSTTSSTTTTTDAFTDLNNELQ